MNQSLGCRVKILMMLTGAGLVCLTTIVFQLLGLTAVVSTGIFNDSLIRSSPS